MRIKHLYLLIGITTSIVLHSQQLTFQLKDITKKTVTFSEIKGEKITVFDFWATWCKPCVQLMPKLNTIYEDQIDSGAEIIGVNIDDPRSINKVKPFISSLGIQYPILFDTDQMLMEKLNVHAVPSVVIVNDNGEILWSHEGYVFGDEMVIKEKIHELVSE